MLKDGTYAAWFRTPAGEGAGVAHLEAGNITGGDSILSYSGSYEVDGEHFKALIRTKRHSHGHPTVFGIDDLTLRIEGKCGTSFSRCSGWADEAPGMLFEATLILSQPEDPPKPEPSPDEYRPEHLPRMPRR